MNTNKHCIRKAVGLAAIIAASTQLSGCGSCSNFTNDMSRDFVKKDYTVTLYSANGDIILKEDLKNTFIDVGENGSGLRYLKNGKSVLINGTYVLEEK